MLLGLTWSYRFYTYDRLNAQQTSNVVFLVLHPLTLTFLFIFVVFITNRETAEHVGWQGSKSDRVNPFRTHRGAIEAFGKLQYLFVCHVSGFCKRVLRLESVEIMWCIWYFCERVRSALRDYEFYDKWVIYN